MVSPHYRLFSPASFAIGRSSRRLQTSAYQQQQQQQQQRRQQRQQQQQRQQRQLQSWRWTKPTRPSSGSGSRHLMSGSGSGSGGGGGVLFKRRRKTTGARYEYTPLSDPQAIRILSLQPGKGDEPLVGSLSVERVAETPGADYEAISYVWGSDGRRSDRLHLNVGEVVDDGAGVDQATAHERHHRRLATLPLTPSACDALRRMRLTDQPRRLWADQVCINQADVAERSHQVGLMNAIYKNAKHILVWLGKDEEGVAGRAVEAVHRLRDTFSDEERHEAFRRAHSGDLSDMDKAPWLPLSRLTSLPWFNRLWIVQEIGTQAPATLFWGDAHIDWEELSFVSVILNQSYHHLRTHFRIFTPNIRYLYRRFVDPDEPSSPSCSSDDAAIVLTNRGSFIYELHRARHLLSKDPRDHIYAFLGHFSIRRGSTGLAGIEVDYGKPVEDVYIDVAVRELRGATNLLLLSACHDVRRGEVVKLNRFKKYSYPIGPRLPSWVPDWRLLPVHVMGSPSTLHRAAGDTVPRLSIDEARRVLHIDGVRVDTVATASFTFYGNAFRLGRRQPEKKPPVQTLWGLVCQRDGRGRGGGRLAFDLERRYASGGSALFAFVQTLTNACIGGDRESDYRPMPPEECLAHGAAFLVRSAEGGGDDDISNNIDDLNDGINNRGRGGSGGSTIEISPEVRALAARGNALKWSHEATLVTRHRRFAITTKGYFVMGPDSMAEGDALVVLYGGRTAFALRERADGWTLLGECYIHGLMNGEALETEDVEEETFSIY